MRSSRTHQGQGIKVLGVSLLFQQGPELVDLRILLGGGVARVAILGGGSGGGVVVVVVLGVERELLCAGGSHDACWVGECRY